MTEKKPEAKYRAGTVSATIWANQIVKDGQPRVLSSVSFEKSYKDKEGTWKTTKSLNVQDLPKAIMVLTKAYEHIALREQDDSALTEEAA